MYSGVLKEEPWAPAHLITQYVQLRGAGLSPRLVLKTMRAMLDGGSLPAKGAAAVADIAETLLQGNA